MTLSLDFAESMHYFPHVIHNCWSIYQQVCDVKLALIGSQNCDCSGNSCCTTDRMTHRFLNPKSHFNNSVTVNGNPYLSDR